MIDLHELANTPGAGKAKAALIKAGKWKEEYTFQDVCDMLDEKNVIVISRGKLACHHAGEYMCDDIDRNLRSAMEAK